MTNRARTKGTGWESAIVDYLRSLGWLHVERRALNGNQDRGDIAGIPGVVIEAKACKAIDLAGWVDEAQAERANDGADLGAVWAKRRGKGSPGDGYVVLPGHAFAALLVAAGYGPNREREAS